MSDKPLKVILEEKNRLEETMISLGGEISAELEVLWEDNSVELKKKIDRYGYVIEDLELMIKTLQDKKKLQTSRLQDAIKRLESEILKIKTRLHYHCEGNPLRGEVYSFHPYESAVTKKIILEKVPVEFLKYQIPDLDFEEYSFLCNQIDLPEGLRAKLMRAEPKALVSDLPPGHEAIVKEITPSVRIT